VLADKREVELVFEHYRIYIRKTSRGFILVFMKGSAPAEKVRTVCDALAPMLSVPNDRGGGIGRFFKRICIS
jgi:hypothetical protein